MKKTIVMEKYPAYSLSIKKSETKYKSAPEIISYFRNLIEKDPVAAFIAEFNHYEHTKSLQNGEITQNIIDAQNIIFCFGQKISNPMILSIRPRSIGVVETNEEFIVSFLEAPNEQAHKKMEAWSKALVN